MRVYKFGGASIAEASKMEALLPIITGEPEPLVIVLSALGKTTNALERIVNHAFKNEKEEALLLAKNLEQQHLAYTEELLDAIHYAKAKHALIIHFSELQQAIKNTDTINYDYSYDQIVCMGELLASHIFSFFLEQNNIPVEWIDIRTVIRTDDSYREGVVDWDYSAQRAKTVIGSALKQSKNVVVQGFIGATAEGTSVTFGRDGSDYTAAILAAMLQLESLTIWKDVNGLQNADPKMFPDTIKIEAISYNEVIEMTFYGAKIIHPKTIKPLQNNNIPLYVKSFLDKNLGGSVIQAEVENDILYPPLIVLKENQVLLQITTRDFSFITENNLSSLYSIFRDQKVKINFIQNAAISFIVSIDNREDKIKALIQVLEKDYMVSLDENVSLLIIRHYTPEIISEHTKGRKVLLKQETEKTALMIMK